MKKTKRFHLGDVLSVTTGILMSPRRIEGVYDILNFMTGDNLFTHQIPRACREVTPALFQQHAWLRDIELNTMTPSEVAPTLAALVEKHGEFVTLLPMSDYTPREPMAELSEMMGKAR